VVACPRGEIDDGGDVAGGSVAQPWSISNDSVQIRNKGLTRAQIRETYTKRTASGRARGSVVYEAGQRASGRDFDFAFDLDRNVERELRESHGRTRMSAAVRTVQLEDQIRAAIDHRR